jgi:hypothetical protein
VSVRDWTSRFGAGTALALLIAAAAPPAWGQRVALHEVPRPVLDAIRARFGEARIAGAETERKGRGVVYEVAIRHQGRKIDVTVTPEGGIRLIKREVAAAGLPGPVASALREAYPGAAYHAAEEVIEVQGPEERITHYEVDLVTTPRRVVEVRIGTDGKILGRAK